MTNVHAIDWHLDKCVDAMNGLRVALQNYATAVRLERPSARARWQEVLRAADNVAIANTSMLDTLGRGEAA